ncbi:STAS domain-containing protein [Actinokineospora sp. NBRC 105648]|uniref:STAS domain-containing protein n=1 Tax=Actinokineospora sp. NBRC 105648 TaxID=3032206 RepID=UPI002552394D|nr:STAS domain-containing protein [Actinokineospora sp. NBRC 105648]
MRDRQLPLLAVDQDTLADNGVLVVTARGQIDLGTVSELVNGLTQAIDHAGQTGAGMVLLDLSGTTFLASVGLAALLEATSTARSAGAELKVITGSAHAVLRALEITGLDTTLAIHPDIDDALVRTPRNPA